MASQPVPGVTSPWGSALIEWLNVGHNADGTIKGTIQGISVKDTPFSAKGDGRSNTNSGQDGAITSGLKVLTSPHTAFASSDVGKLVCVYGAGASGGDLYTTIASVQSSSVATLTLAAGTTVSNAQVVVASDDTAAFNAAYAAVALLFIQMQASGGSKTGTIPSVFIPSGLYGLSGTILPGDAYSRTLGLGQPILMMFSSSQNILDLSGGYVNSIYGITFQGGAKQLRYGNNNLDTAEFLVEKCDFYHNNGQAAIEMYATSGGLLSVMAEFKNCRFIDNYQCFGQPSGVVGGFYKFTNCWVETTNTGVRPPSMIDGALFVNRGWMTFDGLVGVPSPQGATTNARWIDNYGVFTADKSRFGAEGSGMPIVYQFVGPLTTYPYIGQSAVHITNSLLAIGATAVANRGVVYFATDIPQSMIFENNFYLSHDSDPVINTGLITISTYINALNANDFLVVRAKGNQAFVPLYQGGIPAALITTQPTKVAYEIDYFGTQLGTGLDNDVANPSLLLLNKRVISWKDAAGGFTNVGYLFLDTNNAMNLGTGNAGRALFRSGGDINLGGSETVPSAGRLYLTAGGGAQLGAPTGGDKGSGTINVSNATGFYINGSPPITMTQKGGSAGGDYTTASATYVDVDGTNLTYTVTIPTGYKLLINVGGLTVKHSALAAVITVALFDTVGSTTLCEQAIEAAVAGDREALSLSYIQPGDGASHTIKLQWKTSAATATMNNASGTLRPFISFLLTPAS